MAVRIFITYFHGKHRKKSPKQQIILCRTLAKRPKLTICSSRQPHSPGSMEIAFLDQKPLISHRILATIESVVKVFLLVFDDLIT